MTEFFRGKATPSKQSTERIPKFIGIIYQMIEDPRYQDYVSWSTDGCAMLIKKPTEFAEYVLPIFFKHNNFSSFVRQLNLYSFRKKKHYPFDNAFVHGMFKRGQKGLLKYIKRKGNEKYALSPQESSKVPFYGAQEEETSQEELIRQNSYLKKVHQDLSEHVQNVEKKILELSHQNKSLQSKYDQKRQDEELMTKVIKRISAIYGSESVKTVFNAVIEESEAPAHQEVRSYAPEPFAVEREFGHQLTVKPLPGKALRNMSYVAEPVLKSEMRHSENATEERFDSEISTKDNDKEKSVLDELVGGLTPRRNNTNLSSWSFTKFTGGDHRRSNMNDFHEIYFDGNFNPFEHN